MYLRAEQAVREGKWLLDRRQTLLRSVLKLLEKTLPNAAALEPPSQAPFGTGVSGRQSESALELRRCQEAHQKLYSWSHRGTQTLQQ